ncbi:unnamed protein product [Choristocarpus tenellus]
MVFFCRILRAHVFSVVAALTLQSVGAWHTLVKSYPSRGGVKGTSLCVESTPFRKPASTWEGEKKKNGYSDGDVSSQLLAAGFEKSEVASIAGTPSLKLDPHFGLPTRLAQIDFLVQQGVFKDKREARDFTVSMPWALEMDFRVVHEDERFFVIHKPFDVRLNPGNDGENFPEEATCESWVKGKLPQLDAMRFCHQLDYATSGILVLAKDRTAAAACTQLFRQRQAKKQYTALIFGHPSFDTVKINRMICSMPNHRFRMQVGPSQHPPDTPSLPTEMEMGAQVEGQGSVISSKHKSDAKDWKEASTIVTVLQRGRLALNGCYRGAKVSLVQLEPLTGRRHQLRLHCLAMGHPIVGDATYAGDTDSYRMFLHATKLKLPLGAVGSIIRGKGKRRKGHIFSDLGDLDLVCPGYFERAIMEQGAEGLPGTEPLLPIPPVPPPP